MSQASPLIQLDRLTVRRGERDVLADVSCDVAPGAFLAVVGPNGAGKTTLLMTLLGLLRPASGRVAIAGRSISDYGRREIAALLSYVPQADGRPVSFSVREFVSLGRHVHRGRFLPPSREDVHAVDEAMAITATTEYAQRAVSSLSGGERQRVFIAAALAQHARVLLLDEPTTFLDPKYQLEMVHLLRHLNRDRGLTMVMVTHDYNIAAHCGDDVLALGERGVVFHGAASVFLSSIALERVYGVPFEILPRAGGGTWAALRVGP